MFWDFHYYHVNIYVISDYKIRHAICSMQRERLSESHGMAIGTYLNNCKILTRFTKHEKHITVHLVLHHGDNRVGSGTRECMSLSFYLLVVLNWE